jgi:branched-chain amino acid transport system permease protein
LGIHSDILHRLVFVFSGVLAGLGGIYLGIDQNLTPTLGFSITIKAYAALIAGGKSSLRGTFVCAYAIALLEQFVVGIPFFGIYVPAGYQGTVALLVIIAFLLMKPEGLFGSRLRSA